MRENRPYGSEGGVGEKPIPTPITTSPHGTRVRYALFGAGPANRTRLPSGSAAMKVWAPQG
jgi:hypothetical protein